MELKIVPSQPTYLPIYLLITLTISLHTYLPVYPNNLPTHLNLFIYPRSTYLPTYTYLPNYLLIY